MTLRWNIFKVRYFFIIISLASCAATGPSNAPKLANTTPIHWIKNTGTATDVENGMAKLQFIGAGGFHLAFSTGSILVDPFYSNPGLLAVATLRTLAPNTEIIDRHLPPLNDVKAVLVGHAHYDHVLDIPYIATKLVPKTPIYGNVTLKNILASSFESSQVINVEPVMSVDGAGGQWLTVSRHMRVFPIKSNHAPQLGSWQLASGNIEHPQRQLPKDAIDWRSGENVSYLLDLLDDNGMSIYRIFIQTSASSFPNGLPPDLVLRDGKAVDMAVLCAASYQKMKHYPEYLLERLAPQNVVLVHWEKFWTTYDPGQATPLPGLDIERLFKRINIVVPHANVSILQRGAVMTWNLGSNT